MRTRTGKPPIQSWDIHAPLEPLAGGHRNVVLRTRGLPQDWVFKSTGRSEASLQWLTPVHDAAEACGLAVPRLRPNLDGKLVVGGWTCEPFVPGTPCSAAQVADGMVRFHASLKDMPQRPGMKGSQDLLDGDAGGDVNLNVMPKPLVASCRAAWQAVGRQSQSVVHGDLTKDNLRQSPDGRVTVLDWDECRRDVMLFDLRMWAESDAATQKAHLAWEVACSWQIEPEYARRRANELRRLSDDCA